IIKGIERGVIVACHDISDGGLAVASAEMCIGGDVGANLSLEKLGRLRSDVKLFSESNSRWLIEVRKGKEKQLPKDRRTKVVKLGRVGDSSLVIGSSRKLVDLEVEKLAKSFGSTLWRMVG
ncbi:MAG: AIR synthase-related protein, partial [Thermoplasmata archaeon]